MRIAFHTSDKSGDQSIAHDLNFQSERYETKHTVVSHVAGARLVQNVAADLSDGS